MQQLCLDSTSCTATVDAGKPLQLQVTTLDYSEYHGLCCEDSQRRHSWVNKPLITETGAIVKAKTS